MPSRSCGHRLLTLAFVAAAVAPAAVAEGQTALPDLPVTSLERMDGSGRPLRTASVTRFSDLTELDGPRTLSLTVPKPAPIRDVLLVLVRGTRFSAVTESTVNGTFSGDLRDLTIRQALESALFASNLDYEVRGTVIRVFPSRPRTRLFEVNVVAVRRVSGTSAAASAQSADSDVLSEIDAGVRALLSQQGRHHVDRRAGLVQVTDFAERLDQIAIYLEAVQLRAARQIRIDARVLQVVLNDEVWSLDLAALAEKSGTGVRAGTPPSAGLAVTDFDAMLRALGQWGRVTAGGSQRLLALNNEVAVLKMTTGMRPGTGADTSLNMAVLAQISSDGIVQMNSTPRYVDADLATSAEADVAARVRAGETLILSGMQHGGSAATPGAHRVGVIVLLTPTIVSSGTGPQAGER